MTLTYLDDAENAKQAYEQAVTLETKDPNVCLNFGIFLLNSGDKEGARKYYIEFEERVVRFRQLTGSDLDGEVGPIAVMSIKISGLPKAHARDW